MGDTAEPLRADVLLHDGPMPPFVVDNAISDCVEVTASVEAKRIKLRFSVVKPIYKCGCPSAAVRYLIMKAGQPIVSDHFSAMKYTDRWFEAAQGLRLEEASQHSVAVGCNVQQTERAAMTNTFFAARAAFLRLTD